ncbi:hypothetical protein ALC53_07545, partial [Atta colombica]
PNNPDLNLLDYYVWNVVERVINKSRHLNVTSLRTAVEANWGEFNDDGERFHQDIEKRFKGKDIRHMLGEYCWFIVIQNRNQNDKSNDQDSYNNYNYNCIIIIIVIQKFLNI